MENICFIFSCKARSQKVTRSMLHEKNMKKTRFDYRVILWHLHLIICSFQNNIVPFSSCDMLKRLNHTTTELLVRVHKTTIIHNLIVQLVKNGHMGHVISRTSGGLMDFAIDILSSLYVTTDVVCSKWLLNSQNSKQLLLECRKSLCTS